MSEGNPIGVDGCPSNDLSQNPNCFLSFGSFGDGGGGGLHTVLMGLVPIASVRRGIKTVSEALLHVRSNLPLSNFIQPRLVTAEERCVPGWVRGWGWGVSDTLVLQCNSRRERESESGGRASFLVAHQEINLFCGELGNCCPTDRRVEGLLAPGLHFGLNGCKGPHIMIMFFY